MVVLHEPEVVFLKARKTGGTSLEIALSRFAQQNDVLTPIDEDRFRRETPGFRSAQNFANFGAYNHMPFQELIRIAPQYQKFTTIAVVRNPFDMYVSMWFWLRHRGLAGENFFEFCQSQEQLLVANEELYCPNGSGFTLSRYLRYESLAHDIKDLERDIPYLKGLGYWFSKIRAKANIRPKGASTLSIYSNWPAAIELVAERHHAEISQFGYKCR